MQISTRRFPGIFVVVGPTSVSGAPFIEPRRSISMDEEPKQSDSGEQQRNDTAVEQASQPGRHAISRRQFLIISAVAGGVAGTGLLIGFNVLSSRGKAGKNGSRASAPVTSFAPNVWVRIDVDNTVTIQV